MGYFTPTRFLVADVGLPVNSGVFCHNRSVFCSMATSGTGVKTIVEVRSPDGAYLKADGTVGTMAEATFPTLSGTPYDITANDTHIWVFTTAGLARFNRATRVQESLLYTTDFPGGDVSFASLYGHKFAWCGGYLWFGVQGSGAGLAGLIRIDPSDFSMTAFRGDIAVAAAAYNILTVGENIWLSSSISATQVDGGLIRVYNGTTGAAVTTIATSASPCGMAINSAGEVTACISTGWRNYDATAFTFVNALSATTGYMVATSLGGAIAAGNSSTGNLTVSSTASGTGNGFVEYALATGIVPFVGFDGVFAWAIVPTGTTGFVRLYRWQIIAGPTEVLTGYADGCNTLPAPDGGTAWTGAGT